MEWYDELLLLTASPVVRLNRPVAVGEADGPRAGLAALAAGRTATQQSAPTSSNAPAT